MQSSTLSTPSAREALRGLTIERHWQMMGALEATDGMLLFGISTAFIFTVMYAHWPMLTRSPQD